MPESSKKTPRTAPSAADLAAAVRPREDAQEKAALAAIQSIADSLKYLCTTVPSLLERASASAEKKVDVPAKAKTEASLKPKKRPQKVKPKVVSRQRLLRALGRSEGIAARAARELALSPNQVTRLMRQYGIERRKAGRPARSPSVVITKPPFSAAELAAKIGKVLDESR